MHCGQCHRPSSVANDIYQMETFLGTGKSRLRKKAGRGESGLRVERLRMNFVEFRVDLTARTVEKKNLKKRDLLWQYGVLRTSTQSSRSSRSARSEVVSKTPY